MHRRLFQSKHAIKLACYQAISKKSYICLKNKFMKKVKDVKTHQKVQDLLFLSTLYPGKSHRCARFAQNMCVHQVTYLRMLFTIIRCEFLGFFLEKIIQKCTFRIHLIKKKHFLSTIKKKHFETCKFTQHTKSF